MINLLRQFQKERQLRKELLALDQEAAKNLESYYVMFQINRLRDFKLDAWQRIKASKEVNFEEPVLKYAAAIESYQQALKGFHDFENWYTSDEKNKTRENGLVLHQKQEEAKARFKPLEGILKSAVQGIAKELKMRGWGKG